MGYDSPPWTFKGRCVRAWMIMQARFATVTPESSRAQSLASTPQSPVSAAACSSLRGMRVDAPQMLDVLPQGSLWAFTEESLSNPVIVICVVVQARKHVPEQFKLVELFG